MLFEARNFLDRVRKPSCEDSLQMTDFGDDVTGDDTRSFITAGPTGWGQDEDRRRTREAHFDKHIVKPVQIADLQKLLSQS
jgi:hypothetical protein